MIMKRFATYILTIVFTLSAAVCHAQEPQPIAKKEKEKLIEKIVDGYSNWGKVSLTGKLTSDMLPASATVKVYMEKDKLTLISVSAPVVGEVARIELDSDNLLIVNKWSKKYAVVPVSELEKMYPGVQTDLQNLFLGRITIMGKGSLGKRSGNDVEVYNLGNDGMMIVPVEKYQPAGASYAYIVEGIDAVLEQFLLLTDDGSNQLNCYFDWKSSGMGMEFAGYTESFNLTGRIVFNAPAWGANSFGRFEMSSKYTQTSIRNILQF